MPRDHTGNREMQSDLYLRLRRYDPTVAVFEDGSVEFHGEYLPYEEAVKMADELEEQHAKNQPFLFTLRPPEV